MCYQAGRRGKRSDSSRTVHGWDGLNFVLSHFHIQIHSCFYRPEKIAEIRESNNFFMIVKKTETRKLQTLKLKTLANRERDGKF